MTHKFIKAAGCKNEQEFYKKYPNEDSFFKDFPKMKNGGFIKNVKGKKIPLADEGIQVAAQSYNIQNSPKNGLNSIDNMNGLNAAGNPPNMQPGSNLTGVTPNEINHYYPTDPQEQNNQNNTKKDPRIKLQANKKTWNPFKPDNAWNPETGVNLPDVFAGGIQAMNILTANTPIHQNQKPLLPVANTHALGTNTSATYKNGGKILKAKDGKKVKPIYTDDINKVQMYNDSNKLYNNYLEQIKGKNIKNDFIYQPSSYLANAIRPIDSNGNYETYKERMDEIYPSKFKPTGFYSSTLEDSEGDRSGKVKTIDHDPYNPSGGFSVIPIYKKPVQPYIYDDNTITQFDPFTNIKHVAEYDSREQKLKAQHGDYPDGEYNPDRKKTNKSKMKEGGYIKGSKRLKKADDGIAVTPEMREQWNQRILAAKQNNPNYGQEQLNHDPSLGQQMTGLQPNEIGAIQHDFNNMAQGNSPFGNFGKQVAQRSQYPTLKEDKYAGTQTTSKLYPELDFNHNGKVTHYGTNYAKGTKEISASLNKRNIQPTSIDPLNPQQEQSIQPIAPNVNQIDSAKRDASFPTLAQAKTKARTKGQDPSNWYVNGEDRYMKYGGKMAANGVQLLDNGNVENISETGSVGDIVQFNGASHEEGGIPIAYNGKQVEVEGAETGFVDNTGNMHIMGNLHVPGTSTKFKDIFKDIAKQEKKNKKTEDLGTSLLNVADPYNYYSGPSFNTGKVLQDASLQKEVAINKTKEDLANAQNNMLDLAKNMNIEPKEVSKMYKGKAKYGMILAKDGKSVGSDYTDYDPKQAEQVGYDERYGKSTEGLQKYLVETYPEQAKQIIKKHGVPKYGTNKDANDLNTLVDKKNGKRTKEFVKLAHEQRINQSPNLRSNSFDSIPESGLRPMVNYLPETPLYGANTVPITQPNLDPINERPVDFNDLPSPVKHPTSDPQKPGRFKGYKDRLHLSDYLPEIAAMFDKPDPVPAQYMNPRLPSPYRISMQDQIESNQGDFNAAQRSVQNNPAALGALNAQKYDQNNRVYGEQFRQNQGIENNVINQSQNILNQADQFNLQVGDQQMVRQAQALENTRSNRNAAMTSVSTKLAQNRSENAKNQLYTDIYHESYDPKTGFSRDPNYQGQIVYNPQGYYDTTATNKGKGKTEKKYTRNSDGDLIREEDLKMMTGGMMGGSGVGFAMRGMGSGSESKKKKRSKPSSF